MRDGGSRESRERVRAKRGWRGKVHSCGGLMQADLSPALSAALRAVEVLQVRTGAFGWGFWGGGRIVRQRMRSPAAVRGAETPHAVPCPRVGGAPLHSQGTGKFEEGLGGGRERGRGRGERFLGCFVLLLRFFSSLSPPLRRLKQVNLFLFVFLEGGRGSESA